MPTRQDGVLAVCARLGFDNSHWSDRPDNLKASMEEFRKKYAFMHNVSLISHEMLDSVSARIQIMAVTFLEHGIPEHNIAAARSFWERPRGTKKILYTQHKEMILKEVGNLLASQNRNLNKNRYKVKWLEGTPSNTSETSKAERSQSTDTQGSSQGSASLSLSAINNAATIPSIMAKPNSLAGRVVQPDLALPSLVDPPAARARFISCFEVRTDYATPTEPEVNRRRQFQGTGAELPIPTELSSTSESTAVSAETLKTGRKKRKTVENFPGGKRPKVLSLEVENVGVMTPPRGSDHRTQSSSTTNSDAIGSDNSVIEDSGSVFEPTRMSDDDGYNNTISSRELRCLRETTDGRQTPASSSDAGLIDQDVQSSQAPPTPLRVSSKLLHVGNSVSNTTKSSSVDRLHNLATSALADLHSSNTTPTPRSTIPSDKPVSDSPPIAIMQSKLNIPHVALQQPSHPDVIEDPGSRRIDPTSNAPRPPEIDAEEAPTNHADTENPLENIIASLEPDDFRSDEMDKSSMIDGHLPSAPPLPPLCVFSRAQTVPPAFPVPPPPSVSREASRNMSAGLRLHRHGKQTAGEPRAREQPTPEQQQIEKMKVPRTSTQDATMHETAIQTAEKRQAIVQDAPTQDYPVRNAHVQIVSVEDPLPPTATLQAAPVNDTPNQGTPSTGGVEVLLSDPTETRELRWRGQTPLSDNVSVQAVFDKVEKMLRVQSIATLILVFSILERQSGREIFSKETEVNKGDQAEFEWQKKAFDAWVAKKREVLDEDGKADDLKFVLALRPDADGIVERSAKAIGVARGPKFKKLW